MEFQILAFFKENVVLQGLLVTFKSDHLNGDKQWNLWVISP